MRLAVLALAILCTPAFAAPPTVIQAKVQSRRGSPRDLTILLPPGYDAKKRYPVLYMMDGQNLLNSSFHPGGWRAGDGLEHAITHGLSEPMILVGIHHQDRMQEMTFVHDAKHGGGGGSEMLAHVVDEVVPYVEQRYSTRRGKSGRAIGGSSLGGLFAMSSLLRRPDVFGRGLVFSPSVWWADRALLSEVSRSSSIAKQRVVLYNGGWQDGRADAETLRDRLHDKGLQFGLSLFHWTEPDAGHTEPAWATYFPRGLGQLFPAR